MNQETKIVNGVFGEWAADASAMPTQEIHDHLAALQTLRRWPSFRRKFSGTGIFTLGVTLIYELAQRDRSIDALARSQEWLENLK